MDDYLSESEKWEAIKKWLRDNTLWMVAGVALGGAVVGGYNWYGGHVDDQALAASGKYQQIIESIGKGDRTSAAAQIGLMEHDFPKSPYLQQARLFVARSYVDANDLDHAAAALQAVVDTSKDTNLALIARLRLARVQIAQKKPDNALATLKGVSRCVSPSYHEAQGDAYHVKGDDASALKEYQLARTADLTGVTDSELLDLKINDLLADAAGATSKPTQPPAAAVAK